MSPGPVVKEEEEEAEAFQKALEEFELDKLAQWPDLPLALAESVAAAAVPAPEQQEPWPLASLVGHSWAWMSTVPCTPEWVEPEQ